MYLKPPQNDLDHQLGVADARIQLLEYGDFECPFCGAAHPVIKRLIERLGTSLHFSFRNFPLRNLHRYAVAAAIAAEAAALQNKYWVMHDLLLESQDDLSPRAIEELALRVGLDIETFNRDSRNAELEAKVERDFYSGMRSGVNRTPTFFLSGVRFEGNIKDLYHALNPLESR